MPAALRRVPVVTTPASDPAIARPDGLSRRAMQYLGVDRAVFLAVTGKAWSTLSGLVTTLLVAAVFPADLQGYYYTFLAVLALQAFAELGLGIVVSSYASHEWARLEFDRDGRVTGDPESLSRLTSLGRFALKWYVTAGGLFAVGLAAGGFVFFGSTGWDRVSVWGAPWAALSVVAGVNLCLIPFWALLEGCNQVASVYAFRLLQSIVVSAVTWIAIAAGAGLWVVPLVAATSVLTTLVTVGSRYGAFFRSIMLERPSGLRLNWKADILPMQWRIALSWLSGYLTFSLFTPVLFHYHGPVVAGRMGMTWALIGALTGVASSWIAPKAPAFGILIAQRRFVELDRMFWRLTAVVVVIAVLGAVCIWTFVYEAGRWQLPLAERLLAPSETAWLLAATIMVCASLPLSAYLRAHKKEPLLLPSIVSGVLTGSLVVVLGKHYSASGVAIGYLVATALVTPLVWLVWQRRRIEWHAPGTAA
jgi:O-antigen/teichoic acid export membrane protein